MRDRLLLAAIVVLALLDSGRSAAAAAPQAITTPLQLIVTAADYRVSFDRYVCQVRIELRDSQGKWQPLVKRSTQGEFALVEKQGLRMATGPARLTYAVAGDRVTVGVTTQAEGEAGRIVAIHWICTDEGILVRFAAAGRSSAGLVGCWPLPRFWLDDARFDGYAYWDAGDQPHSGRIADLGESQAYAGVSYWGRRGDTTPRLSTRHPALIVRSESAGIALGEVMVGEQTAGGRRVAFLQRYSPSALYLYSIGAGSAAAGEPSWGWLAPFPAADPAAAAVKVERLVAAAPGLMRGFGSIAAAPDPQWGRPPAEFPAALRRSRPVARIDEAVAYTVNEPTVSAHDMSLAAAVGSDVLIRGWFKWHQADDWTRLAPWAEEAHRRGWLFGGGITCSALYEGENGLTPAEVRAMATRGPDGRLVDAWEQPGCRHGTLSNPAYREYLLSWCRKQIDAGADYLFMDEINAALQANEGFDDYSTADFREFLLRRYCAEQGWSRSDARWPATFKIALSDRQVCPDGGMGSFQYRGYLQSLHLVADPHQAKNPLAGLWHQFRADRDDRAWKWLTDAIRAYAASRGRRVLLSGNGLARYVDLQVLGVWDQWRTAEGAVDLTHSQMDDWGALVTNGWSMAGKHVPVVLFHDWGFHGFPWMEISPVDRKLWMRVRGAEIYAAGGFFAFPIRGPQGDDASHDGTLVEVARQTAFYQQQRDLYLGARVLGFEPLRTSEPLLSLALWQRESPPALVLHAINRQTAEGRPTRRRDVAVEIPADALPRRVSVVSPDWSGRKPGRASLEAGQVRVVLPELEAYGVAILEYDRLPTVHMAHRKNLLLSQWSRPLKNRFAVDRDGLVADGWALNGLLQGRLHTGLRNPPTFLVQMPEGGSLCVQVQAVARAGARLELRVDGKLAKTVDLPDKDGKNDSSAHEYDEAFDFPIPPGRHQLTLDNTGGDWVRLAWCSFSGRIEP